MTARMEMSEAVPEGYRAVLRLAKYCGSQVDRTLSHLVALRTSVVNGCAFCVHMHSHDALADGEDVQRMFQVAAWHDATCFTPAERAVLALTDAVTRIADGGVPDEVWEQARSHFSEEEIGNLIVAISTMNVWNRFAISTRKEPEAL
jgi:AhpD family alkylhydroperoxidase